MIPKIIHYCWFGKNPIPQEFLNYIESWKKFCPDYEIKRWDETNFDLENCPDYVKQAYNAKKWAFVSDYARFKIIYDNGGIYFDTDVELLKPLDDVVNKGAFMGLEHQLKKKGLKQNNSFGIAAGLGIGASANHPLYKEILDYYNTISFYNADGSLNQATVVEYVTNIFKSHGFIEQNTFQTVCGINIYPSEYFNPIDSATGKVTMTQNTISIHHYSASWVDNKAKLKNKLKKLLGPGLTGLIISVKSLFKKEK